MKNVKPIPEFESEAQEGRFWESQDSTDYVDWNAAQSVLLPNLKPSTKTISLRLPEGLLDSIKIEANKRDMPYQSLIKSWLAEEVKDSRGGGLIERLKFSEIEQRKVFALGRRRAWVMEHIIENRLAR